MMVAVIFMVTSAFGQTLTHQFTTPDPSRAQVQDTYLEAFLQENGPGNYVLRIQAPQSGTFISNARDYNARHIIRNVAHDGEQTCRRGFLEPEHMNPQLRPRFHSFVSFLEGQWCASYLWKENPSQLPCPESASNQNYPLPKDPYDPESSKP